MSDEDYKKFEGRGERHQGSERSSPYPVSRMAPAIDLVDLAKEISQADSMLNTRASSKLKVIADQIKSLQQEARDVLEEATRDKELHRAQCNFKRIPGTIYHLYERPDGTLYFSMLSPQEWGKQPPHEYQGSYRLEVDMSWTPAEQLDTPDDTQELVNRLLGDQSSS